MSDTNVTLNREDIEKHNQQLREFKKYVDTNDYMGIILRSHLFIENQLMQLISEIVIKPQKLNLPYFSSKLDAAYALGIIEEDWYGVFNKFNKIRNKYGHDLGYEYSETDYTNLVSSLNSAEQQELQKELDLNIMIFRLEGKKIESYDALPLSVRTVSLLVGLLSHVYTMRLYLDLTLERIYNTKKLNLIENNTNANK